MRSIRRTAVTAIALTAVFVATVTSLVPSSGWMPQSAPVIDFPPTPQTTILGGTAHFTVIASGTPPFTYQWRKDDVDLADGGKISGATADALTLNDVRFDDAADYSVVVGNAEGSATSVDADLTVTVPQGGDVDFSFDPGSSINGPVSAVALVTDGKVLVTGSLTSVSGAARGRIARLNPDGSTDHTFGNGLAGANNYVAFAALQPDGRVLIGGSFTTVNGVGRNRVARLNTDGSLDATFLNGPTGANDPVYALAVQPDGRVLIGGVFTTVNGVSRSRVARLNADGSLDTTFLDGFAGADLNVFSLALQTDGRVLIGGVFTTVNGVSRNRVARLNADGSLDTTFMNGLAGANGTVNSIALQPDGRVLIGGAFTTVNGIGPSRVARLNADGSVDATFFVPGQGLDASVLSLALQSDGRVLIGGFFTTVNGVSRNYVARLNVDGSLDTTFLNGLSGPNNPVNTLGAQPDGRVLVGGSFTAISGVSRNQVARLNADGSLDASFFNELGGPNGGVGAFGVQPDGRVLIGGGFFKVNGLSRNHLARLNADGSLDTNFLNGLSGASDSVYSIALQPDGRALIGGAFFSINAGSKRGVARLNADGSLDTTFLNGLAGANDNVSSVVLQPDGRVLIGGSFTTVNGVSRNRLARLNPNGSLDTTFLNGLAGASDYVASVALQPDGRVLIGGYFSAVNGVSRNRVARLNSDGSLDTTFLNGLAGTNNFILCLALQPDGRVLIGGYFTRVNGVTRNHIARINSDGSVDTTFLNGLAGASNEVFSIAVQPDGRVLIGGYFTTVNGLNRNYVARLNADGSVDTTFLNGLVGLNDFVGEIALQADGRVLIGGNFTTFNGVSRNYIARLYGSTPVAPTISAEPSAQVSYDGCCAVFRVTATGTPLDYRWRKDGVELEDGPGINGARSATLTLTGVTSGDEGDYSLVVNNVLGSDTSLDAALTVTPVPQCKVATCDPILGCVLVDAEIVPSETSDVTITKTGADATIAWTLAAGATTSDVLRGDLASLPVGPGGGDEVCLGSTAATTITDSDVSAAGSGVWYLVRGSNSCAGSGPYGLEGVQGLPGAPRVSSTCP